MAHFGREQGFWEDLLRRARRHGLERILYYLIRYACRVLDTPVPSAVRSTVEAWRPNLVARLLMDAAVMSALRPTAPGESRAGHRFAVWILYLRSHWLKMPLSLLVRHFLVKTAGRLRTRLRLPAPGIAADAN